MNNVIGRPGENRDFLLGKRTAKKVTTTHGNKVSHRRAVPYYYGERPITGAGNTVTGFSK